MFSFFHWLVLSVVVRLPRVLPVKWAQALLVRWEQAAPRLDWLEYSTAIVIPARKGAGYTVECLSWNHSRSTGFRNVAGLTEANPLWVYLWRCTTPKEVSAASFACTPELAPPGAG